jgi:hypothetical protein
MLGLRKTAGSQDIPWPHSNILLQNFNSPNQLISVEEIQRVKSVSKLSVGARGLMKHSHRSSDGYWGSANGTEFQKNDNANRIA